MELRDVYKIPVYDSDLRCIAFKNKFIERREIAFGVTSETLQG